MYQGRKRVAPDGERDAVQALLAYLVQVTLSLLLVLFRLCCVPGRLVLQAATQWSGFSTWPYVQTAGQHVHI